MFFAMIVTFVMKIWAVHPLQSAKYILIASHTQPHGAVSELLDIVIIFNLSKLGIYLEVL